MKPLRLLLLEDDPCDIELVRRTLVVQWPECELLCVDSKSAFQRVLAEGGIDAVLSDYFLPDFDGLQALELTRKLFPKLPFLFVSGAIGDEVAVECLKAGGTDYVLKDRLVKLVPAIRRALKEAEESGLRERAEEQLRQSEEQYRDLFENTTDLIQSVSPEGRFVYVNRAWLQALEYGQQEVATLDFLQVVHPEYREACRYAFSNAKPGTASELELIFLTRSGRQVYVEGNISGRFTEGKLAGIRGIFHDVTERKLALVALKRSVREFEALVNSVDGIVWQADFPSLRFTFVSRQAERFLGYPVRRWLEEPSFWESRIHPDDRDRAVALCTQLTAERKYHSFEYRMLAADGQPVWLRDIVSIRDEGGQPRQVQGIMVNITPRKLAETAHRESEALKSVIMEAELDCIMILDSEGRVVEFNPAAEKTLGYSRAEVLGLSLVEILLSPALRTRYSEAMAMYPQKSECLGTRREVTAVRAGGLQFPAELAIVPLQLGEHHVFVTYLRDITERKQTEARMRRIQAKLRQINFDLKRRNREIQNFYHTLSHELKTPLTSAREFICIVKDGLGGPLNQTQLDYLEMARQSCDQLTACINDLLDATRLETGKLILDLKPASFGDLVQKVAAALGPQATGKKIRLAHEIQPDLPSVHLDEHRITQVLSNLVNNAIKYTPVGGRILLKVTEDAQRPELLRISVSDTGCGIPKNEQERIFDRLYQVKSGDAATEQGVGLGLYLCRELVELHGGSIGVESNPGKGSTFSFVIPKSQQALLSNLLIIGDNPDMLKRLRDLLSAEQYNVRTACDGPEALEELRRRPPDVVMLDLAAPNVNGPLNLKEIRKNWGEVPVILHTAFSDFDRMREALQFSPFTLLAKPCSTDQIVKTIREVQRSGDTARWEKTHEGLRKPKCNSPESRNLRNCHQGN
jgi:two-component system, OmpR family, sensor histidine kinase VicK